METLDGKISHYTRDYAAEYGITPHEWHVEAAIWSLMLKTKLFVPIEEIKGIYEREEKLIQDKLEAAELLGLPEAVSNDCEVCAVVPIEKEPAEGYKKRGHTEYFFKNKEIAEAIETHLGYFIHADDGVRIEYRLLEALKELLKTGEFVSIENARRICLVLWLLTRV